MQARAPEAPPMVQPRSKTTAEQAVLEVHWVLVLGPPSFMVHWRLRRFPRPCLTLVPLLSVSIIYPTWCLSGIEDWTGFPVCKHKAVSGCNNELWTGAACAATLEVIAGATSCHQGVHALQLCNRYLESMEFYFPFGLLWRFAPSPNPRLTEVIGSENGFTFLAGHECSVYCCFLGNFCATTWNL